MHRNSTGGNVRHRTAVLADGRLNIDLSVDFEGLRMPSDESLTLTPVLISGENEQALPAVFINGKEKQKSVPAAKGICRKRASGPHTRSSDKERRQDGALLPIPWQCPIRNG